MWHIQTPIDGLLLPTDTEGRLRLTGHVPAWHHIVSVRERTDQQAEMRLASAPLRWEIRPWHQIGSRLYLRDATEYQDDLLQMVRQNAQSACSMAVFPKPGKRASDSTIHLTIVTPPERFAQYSTMVRFSMTLPVGSVNITLPTPWVTDLTNGVNERTLLAPGSTALLEETELAVSRAAVVAYNPNNLRPDRRTPPVGQQAIKALTDDDNEWMAFRRDEPAPNDPRSRMLNPRQASF